MPAATDEDGALTSASSGVRNVPAADRIRELCAIDQDVTRSLEAAGKALTALTGTTANGETAEDADQNLTLAEAKEAFSKHSSEFMELVQSVSARLRRQVYALEEAGIIPSKNMKIEQPPAPPAPAANPQLAKSAGLTPQQSKAEQPMQITNAGLGNLDVGWLNSRRDEVGRQKDRELWAEARSLLEAAASSSTTSTPAADKMDTDNTDDDLIIED